MNRQLNQVVNQRETKQVSKRAEFLGCSFSTIPNNAFEVIYSFKSNITTSIALYFYKYFSSETGTRKNYKVFVISELEKVLKKNKSSLVGPLKELEESNLFIMINLGQKGKVVLMSSVLGQQYHKEYLEGKRQFDISNKEVIINHDIVVNFPQQNTNQVVHSDVLPNTEPVRYSVPLRTLQCTPPYATVYPSVRYDVPLENLESIDNTSLEDDFKKSQESFLKNPFKETSLKEEKKEKGFFEKENKEEKSLELKPILKTQVEILEQKKEKIEFYFPTDAELEAKKKIENEIAKIRLDEMMAKIKAEKEAQKNNVPGPAPKPLEKSFVVETVSQNIDGDIVKEEKIINRLELNEEQRELREKIQEELNIININQFEDFFYKLDFDTYYETVSFVISEYKSGNVKSPSNYLKACLNKKVESQGIENLTTPFYWQQIFRYFNSFHFDKGNVVCTKSGVTLAHQMSANQDRVFLYLSTVFREVKKGNEEKQKELIEVFQAMGKFGLTVQEFKEIVSFNSATKENKEELIKIFREVI